MTVRHYCGYRVITLSELREPFHPSLRRLGFRWLPRSWWRITPMSRTEALVDDSHGTMTMHPALWDSLRREVLRLHDEPDPFYQNINLGGFRL